MELGPKQTPNPHFWYGVRNRASLQFAAEHGMHMVSGGPNKGLQDITMEYQRLWNLNRNDVRNLNPNVKEPKMGALRHVFVAETDEEATAVATPAYKDFYTNIEKLWLDFGVTHTLFTPKLEVAKSLDIAIIGNPKRVRDEVAAFFAKSGCNYLLASFAWGSLTQSQSETSLGLFADQVMPHF